MDASCKEICQVKRTAFDHPKFRRLARLLNLPAPWGPLGIMEALSHFTAKHAPQGDIGKWSDEEIADGIGWDQDPSKLIDALVEARLFDRHPTYRLVVHDWHEHCDDSTRKTLKRNGLDFISAEPIPQESGHVPDTSGHFRKSCACQSQSQSQSQPPIVPQGTSGGVDEPADAKPKRTRFSPPTLQEVTVYCIERQNGITPQDFVDYYAARGWKLNNGVAMKDWRAAVRTWESRRGDDRRETAGPAEGGGDYVA